MISPEKGMDTPPQKNNQEQQGSAPQENWEKTLSGARDSFEEARFEFYENAPDFSKIKDAIDNISNEIKQIKIIFESFFDLEEYGGGINQERIDNLKSMMSEFEEKIQEAESLIDNNASFESYRQQVKAARKIKQDLAGKIDSL